MDGDWLKAQLAQGRSFESIAREVGKHPSTVAYWAKKFGLESSHVRRHAAKGAIERLRLESLLANGHSIRSMAFELGASYQTVRYWLNKYGLTTSRARRLHATRAAMPEGAIARIPCSRHGLVAHRRRPDGGYRCVKCRSEAVARRRRRVKAILVTEHGGHCVRCGFDETPAALHFHHIDPTAKSFALSAAGVGRSLAKARAEAAKCVLLCANCHAVVEAGHEWLRLTPGSPDNPTGGRFGPG